MNTIPVRSLSARQKTASKAVSIATTLGLSGLSIAKAASMTTVVAGSSVAPGAIKAAVVLTSSGPVTLSVVKASLGAKIFMGAFFVALSAGAGYIVYEGATAAFQIWNARDKKAIETTANSLNQ